MTNKHDLDVITIGRASVDLYGQQIGGRLEDMASFAKSVGGCPANIAIGTSRLGLKSGFISRVGDEQMGRYIREQMQREGVAVEGITTDPERLTALVLLGVRDDETFPLIFYRENCADMALCETDIAPDYIKRARSVLISGTHLSTATVAAASKKAISLAKTQGSKVILDIDYRPNLWGLAGHEAGEERYIRSDKVTEHLQSILPDCDLIVGTEEEVHIAGGSENTLEALSRIRSLSEAVIVLKRGPMGCVVFPATIPDNLDKGITGPGFPVEVYNVLGAGDSFMSGFLRGWLRDEPYETCAQWANACGAFAVSRLLCSPEIPTWDELQYFLNNGSKHKALRKDTEINHVHWATTRRPADKMLMAFAIDHRSQLEEMAERAGASPDKISEIKQLAVRAAARVADGRPDYGMLLDSTYGTKALYDAAKHPLWIGRPVELPGSRPLDFDQIRDLGSHLSEWPVNHVIKCLCFYHPNDPADLREQQEQSLLRLYEAARRVGRELLIEIIAGKHGALKDDTIPIAMRRFYDLGIKPDWWKLEPQTSKTAWQNIGAVIAENDRYCRGIVLLGLEAPEEELKAAFASAISSTWVKGFAVGRTIFAQAAEAWLKGEISDEEAINDMENRFRRLTDAWLEVCNSSDKK
ncbi:bifunctional 5-dehydro-2-deoxygluconokinase/5-dehydro-2-deoxyphosphogluconate aldolase [Kiloniella laminariae]|uniref:bifunctional 5-dehydro-2-deoxygluconokinase/5-dehydro-2- deoxyphosphogluconate aldolase n=1 Tax=Kiloniella laminariae TaxID=454162 RepID=UPI00036EE25B|nr:5-dehydro-2-deoxygluconokinase [Kiloniella laminariae]